MCNQTALSNCTFQRNSAIGGAVIYEAGMQINEANWPDIGHINPSANSASYGPLQATMIRKVRCQLIGKIYGGEPLSQYSSSIDCTMIDGYNSLVHDQTGQGRLLKSIRIVASPSKYVSAISRSSTVLDPKTGNAQFKALAVSGNNTVAMEVIFTAR